MRGRNLGGALVAMAWVIVPACDGAGDGDRGSETHWLDYCESDASCGVGLKCVCGACTLPCSDDGACSGLGATAMCAPVAALDALCGVGVRPSTSLCVARCSTTRDCRGGESCRDGVCSIRTQTKLADSGTRPSEGGTGGSVPDASVSGTGGAGSTGGQDASARPDAARDAGADGGTVPPDASVPFDAGADSGSATCKDGFHVVSTGECRPILLSDDFESGTLPGPWQLWRRVFDETGGRINVGDGPRPGFNYGAAGSGRSALLATDIGDQTWTDYRLDFDAEVTGAGTFDPYALSSCTRKFSFYFRVQQQSESWNEPLTSYAIGIDSKSCGSDVQGTVSMGTFHNYFCPGIGWGCPTDGESRGLITVQTPAMVDGPNHYTVEVVGNEIKLWVNGVGVFDYTDDVVPYPVGTAPVTHGGFTFEWVWELMGWADNVVVTDMR